MDNQKVLSAGQAHVVMLAQYLPLHFLSTMQKLSRKVGRLTLLLSEAMDATRDWDPDFTGLEVRVQKSWRIGVTHRHPLGFKEPGSVIIPYSTIFDLRKLKPDVVISVEVGPRTLQAAMMKRLGAKFKLIVQVRESENTAQSRGFLRRHARRNILPAADCVFVNGASGKRHVLDCGVTAEKICIVPSGTDTVVFGNALPLPQPHKELRLLYVGQLIPRKGIVPFAYALAEAARKADRVIHWSIAGRGFQETELRSIVWPANLTVEYLGPKPYRELPLLYSAADAFVMPSLSDEWGMVVNEAMASGLPVLGCTGVQAVEELVTDGETGWTYAPADDTRLQERLAKILSASPRQLLEMGIAARRKALQTSDDFTASAILRGIEKVCAP